MTEKTMQGKKCPQCHSFVRDDSSTCSVCGFELRKKMSSTQVEKGEILHHRPQDTESQDLDLIACPKCGTENSKDFRFCKICKHPLQDVAGGIPGKTEQTDRLQLCLYWKVKPADDYTETRLSLNGLSPFFIGYGCWQDHAFFVYPSPDGHQILVKKADIESSSTLFRKCPHTFMVESGREFYLGAVRFQVLGDLGAADEDKTVMKSDKTVLRGPGEKQVHHFLAGKSRIKIKNLKSEHDSAEIKEATPVGRNFVAEFSGLGEEELRNSGISKDHIRITPFIGGKWLLEPRMDKPVFEEINEIPLLLKTGDTLRWVCENKMGEFEIHVVIKEV